MRLWDPSVDIPLRHRRIWWGVFFTPTIMGLLYFVIVATVGEPGRWANLAISRSVVAAPILCLCALCFIRTHFLNRCMLALLTVVAFAGQYLIDIIVFATLSLFVGGFEMD